MARVPGSAPLPLATLASGTSGDRSLDLAGTGKAPDLLLREDELAVELDVEDASGALDQLRAEAQLLLQLVRQTGGAGQIVSGYAILDREVFGHRSFPPC
jgi:hypothetical protein